MGTCSHYEPSFHLYESETLRSVGLCDRVALKSHPRYLPRPYDINSVQALACRLCLVKYFEYKGWRPDMSMMELVRSEIMRKSSPNKPFAGGFVIGDGTGVGKTREIASVLVSIVLYEKSVQDATIQFGPSIFGHDSSSVIHAVNQGGWRRYPFFIWMTCSRSLFSACQEGIKEVVTNSRYKEKSWKPFPDRPSYFRGDGKSGSISITTKNLTTDNMEDTHIRFYLLQDIKDAVKDNRGGSMTKVVDFFTAAPTVLFMTYADLNANLEFVLKFITGGGGDIQSNVGPIDTFVTAIMCDEFHKPKNISDAFRGELEKIWAEEDRRVLSNAPRPPTPSVSEVVSRFRKAMLNKDKQFAAKNHSSKKSFLSLLRLSDSFRLLIEVIKYDTFCLMASATPFQGNADLHSVDHILRRTVPAYTSIAAFSNSGNSSTPDAIAENSEYSTVFLEQVVKLLRNQGQLVSRCISIENVECSVINCSTTPIQRYAIDELSSYCLEAKQMLIDSKELGGAIRCAIGAMAVGGRVSRSKIKEFVYYLNRLNSASELPYPNGDGSSSRLASDTKEIRNSLSRMDRRFTAILFDEEETSVDGKATISSILLEAATAAAAAAAVNKKANAEAYADVWPEGVISPAAQELFDAMNEDSGADPPLPKKRKIARNSNDNTAHNQTLITDSGVGHVFVHEWFEKLRKQYYINTASVSVAICKSALLSIKAQTAADAVKRLRVSSPQLKKAVMSLEQTGDSFLSGLAGRVFSAPIARGGKKRKLGDTHNSQELPNHAIVDVNIFDSSPLSNIVLAGYRILCRAVSIATTVSLRTETGNNSVYVMLVPTLPPIEPLIALSGNSLDTIEQCVGEANHAEITNRKLSCRTTSRGMMILRPNQKTSNTNLCIRSFNNTETVDVMMLGPKGNTGLSLHDSKSNSVYAKRIHFLLDLPYNAISFLQTIGRTHRNGQLSIPHFLIFTTDSPAERRFFDSLENRVKDSKAGTFADRYSSNSISITSAVDREQFLDKGLVLKTVGVVIRVLCSDLTPIDLFTTFAKMTIDIGGPSGASGRNNNSNQPMLAFVEGLNGSNRLFVQVLILGLHITIAALGRQRAIRCPQRLGKALDFIGTLSKSVIFDIASAASRIVFSNLCLNLIHHRASSTSTADTDDENLDTLAHAAAEILRAVSAFVVPTTQIQRGCAVCESRKHLPAKGRDCNVDLYTDLVTTVTQYERNRIDGEDECRPSDKRIEAAPLDELVTQILCHNRPDDVQEAIRIASMPPVVTVRILGSGEKYGVISDPGCGLLTSDMIHLVPVVAASSVINTLAKENPGLVMRLHNASSPHKQFLQPYSNTSYILRLARKLSAGSLDFRQFQNNFFSPKNESELMLDTFSNVKSIMARDERLDGLCETRMNSVMGASYVAVRKRPKCVFRAKLLGPELKRHIACFDEGDEEEGDANQEHFGESNIFSGGGTVKNEKDEDDHDLDIVLCNGIQVTLTKANSAFVKEHVDLFVAGNVIRNDGTILQLCFDNCDIFPGLPRFCLYETKKSPIGVDDR